MDTLIYGRGGDSSSDNNSSSGTEFPDTLSSKSYVKAIDLLGEGEFEEVLVGGLTGLLLDDVPVQNENGTYNYTGISVETRPGSLEQTRMNVGGTIESTESVGIELRYNLPVEYSVAAAEADIVRVNVRVPSLTSTDVSNGNITGTSVSYKIEWKDSVSSTWNTVNDGTYVTTNKVVATANGGVALFNGYINYSYIVKLNSYAYEYIFSPRVTYGYAAYNLQKRVNGGTWQTIKSSKFVKSSTISGSISALETDVVELRVVFTSAQTTPSPVYVLKYSNSSRISVSAKYQYATGVQKISGKSSSEYEKQTSFRISGTAPWIVRLTRLTEDSTSAYLQNKTYFSSATTVLEEKLRYPGSVLVGGTYDAEQFSSIPTRAFLCKCLRVKVPTNYDPITREYSGVWDGSFKVAWTDNPAWCFYDLLTNTRYGLGGRIPESYVDKAELYTIGQYCDELVPGYDGIMEPRFTCNVVIQTKEEAYKVISDFASIFRGMTYWASGTITPIQDRPQDVSYAFNNTNVVDGLFTYQSSTLASRYNTVCVTWNNPDNFYKREVEYVEDADLITSLGYVNETSVVAFGCSSRAMARRVGRWLIYTNNYQTDTIAFTTGAEGSIPRPGDVIKVSDTLRSQDHRGGRIASSTLSGATLDKNLTFNSGTQYTFSAIDAEGLLVERTFSANGSTNSIVFDIALTQPLAVDSIYIIADDDIEPQQFKVISVSDKGESKYEVNAVSYNPSKYDYIEKDIPLVNFNLPTETVYPVEDIDYVEYLYADGVSVKSRCDLSWKATTFSKQYIVNVRKPDGTVVNETVAGTSYNLLDTAAGDYVISITSINIIGQQSVAFTETISLYGKLSPPKKVENLEINAVAGEGYLTWDTHSDLDVVVGGYIVVYHSTKTTGATWTDGVFVTKVPGATTSTFVPLLGGTYMAKAIDSSEMFSADAAFALSDFALLQQKNVVDTMEESPSFTGIKTDMRVDGSSLTLLPVLMMDSAGFIDDYSSFDYLGGGVVTQGEYEFRRVVDLGAVYKVNVSGSISARSVEILSSFDERADLIDSWVYFDSLVPESFTTTTYISTTNDDTSGTPVWSDWAELKIATYSARGFKFKLMVESVSSSYTVYVDELSATVDVDDRAVGDNDVNCPPGGLSVTFTPSFMFTPAISIAINNMVQGDYYEISSKTADGFSVVVKDSTNTAVTRVVDYIAKGYGYKS